MGAAARRAATPGPGRGAARLICGGGGAGAVSMREYDMHREAGMRLNDKLMKSKFLTKDITAKAGTLLGVRDKSGVMAFKSEMEMHATMDVALCDLRGEDGRTPVQAYMEDVGPANDVERGMLEARIGSRTSLFRVESSDAAGCTVDLSDQLREGRSVTIRDRGLSMSTSAGEVMFFRLFRLPKFNTTSGVSFVFSGSRLPALLRRYNRMWKRPDRRGPVSRYALFFRLHRRYGAPTRFTDEVL